MNKLPRIAITPGEPAGIGPDICVKLAQHNFEAELVFIGDPNLLQQRADSLGIPINVVEWNPQQQHMQTSNALQVLPIPVRFPVVAGEINPLNAHYVLEALEYAINGCKDGMFDAMVTGPIQKSAINDAGIPFSGHTEFLAERTSSKLPVMMLATEGLRVALVTTHLPLHKVSETITSQLVEEVAQTLHRDLKRFFGIEHPRITVCGLNPHAGEEGHLGQEEKESIEPALKRLRDLGMSIKGPLPADTLFTPKYLEDADAVLAMYHDQGLPVLKYIGFGNAINITLGLPIVRTSVDHGTALELAGTGKANANSLILATNTAIDIIHNSRS